MAIIVQLRKRRSHDPKPNFGEMLLKQPCNYMETAQIDCAEKNRLKRIEFHTFENPQHKLQKSFNLLLIYLQVVSKYSCDRYKLLDIWNYLSLWRQVNKINRPVTWEASIIDKN